MLPSARRSAFWKRHCQFTRWANVGCGPFVRPSAAEIWASRCTAEVGLGPNQPRPVAGGLCVIGGSASLRLIAIPPGGSSQRDDPGALCCQPAARHTASKPQATLVLSSAKDAANMTVERLLTEIQKAALGCRTCLTSRSRRWPGNRRGFHFRNPQQLRFVQRLRGTVSQYATHPNGREYRRAIPRQTPGSWGRVPARQHAGCLDQRFPMPCSECPEGRCRATLRNSTEPS